MTESTYSHDELDLSCFDNMPDFDDWVGYDLESLLQQPPSHDNETPTEEGTDLLEPLEDSNTCAASNSTPTRTPTPTLSVSNHSTTKTTVASNNNRKSKIWFLEILKEVLTTSCTSTIITWLPHGKAFQIRNKGQFRFLCRRKFGLSLKVFIKKLEMWGFRELSASKSRRRVDAGAYYHPLFARDEPTNRIKSQKHSARSGLSFDDPEPNLYATSTTSPVGGVVARAVTPPIMVPTAPAPAAGWYGMQPAPMFASAAVPAPYAYFAVMPMMPMPMPMPPPVVSSCGVVTL